MAASRGGRHLWTFYAHVYNRIFTRIFGKRIAATTMPQASFAKVWFYRAKITSQNLISTQKLQGWRGLYTGLGPSILGIAPATAIKFYTYGNCKRIYANWFHVEDSASSLLPQLQASSPEQPRTQSGS
ncbi:hypothetical protein D6D25_08720 [Aureobasidium pullulans]|nr:hypothetical protein D6D25_08720 [Aureobasidium pullulans]